MIAVAKVVFFIFRTNFAPPPSIPASKPSLPSWQLRSSTPASASSPGILKDPPDDIKDTPQTADSKQTSADASQNADEKPVLAADNAKADDITENVKATTDDVAAVEASSTTSTSASTATEDKEILADSAEATTEDDVVTSPAAAAQDDTAATSQATETATNSKQNASETTATEKEEEEEESKQENDLSRILNGVASSVASEEQDISPNGDASVQDDSSLNNSSLDVKLAGGDNGESTGEGEESTEKKVTPGKHVDFSNQSPQ